MRDSIGIAPGEKLVIPFFALTILHILKPLCIELSVVHSPPHTLHLIEELQEAELLFNLHCD